MQRKVPESVSGCYDLIERQMLKGPWVMGESYTICDPYLFTFAQWLEDDQHNIGTTPGMNGDYRQALKSIRAKSSASSPCEGEPRSS